MKFGSRGNLILKPSQCAFSKHALYCHSESVTSVTLGRENFMLIPPERQGEMQRKLWGGGGADRKNPGEESALSCSPRGAFHYLTGGDGIIPGKTYAWSMTITPTMAASTMECQKTLRKIGPMACERS